MATHVRTTSSPARIAVLASRPRSGETGGAERFFDGLVRGLNAAGIRTDLIPVLSDESTFDTIEESYLRCYDLDMSAYDAVISTKAPTYAVRHPNHICYLVHTMRVFYDMFEQEFAQPPPALQKQRQTIHQLDTGALAAGRTRKIFSIGHEVTNRLSHWNGVASQVLHPGLVFDNFRTGPYGDYLFLPGRLHRWKRVDLIIRAFRYVRHSISFKIAGTGEDEQAFRQLAAGDDRIEFLGRISDQQLVDLYAGALAIPFVPIHEDYGYITLEAFRSGKPVITCSDSGEPTYFVKNGETGFVCDTDPEQIAACINYLYEHRDEARRLGERGRQSIQHIQWPAIIERLLASLTRN